MNVLLRETMPLAQSLNQNEKTKKWQPSKIKEHFPVRLNKTENSKR